MLTLFHDYTSPASAVAVARLQRLANEGVEVEFVGFESIGVDMLLPVTVDVLAEMDRVAVAAENEGVTLRRPRSLPMTGLAHIVEEEAQRQARGADWRSACYGAFWADGAALCSRAVLLGLAADSGLECEAIAQALADPLRLAAVRRRTTSHRRSGVGGVPTLLAHRTLVPGLLDEQELRALGQL